MVDVQIPRSHFRNAHVVSAQFGRLDVPHDTPAIRVLVTDLHQSCRDPVHILPVHVESVPGVRIFYNRVSLERFFEQYSFDGYPQVNEFQRRRNGVRRELELYCRQVSRRPGTMVYQIQPGSRNLEAFLYHLNEIPYESHHCY